MHLDAFGSICGGEVSSDSDVNLLAIVESQDSRFDPNHRAPQRGRGVDGLLNK
jgi:hypothetical protein